MGLLDGKTALVTGVANRWSIAHAIARGLHAHGARVALTYQNDRVRAEVEKLASALGGAPIFACDVSSDASLGALRESVVRELEDGVDILVHSIAYADKSDLAGRTYRISRAGFHLALDVSAFSLLALVAALDPVLNDRGSVIALTYYGATAIVPNYNVMGIAKAALESAVRYLALDLGERGIRVNAISAGPIKTASSRQVKGLSAIFDSVGAVAPLQRNVTSDDVANVAVYLASDLAGAVTADVHFVDAGYHAMGVAPVATQDAASRRGEPADVAAEAPTSPAGAAP